MASDESKECYTIQFIVADINKNVRYYKKCIVQANKKKKHVIIKPSENESEFIYIAFDRSFVNVYEYILYIDECQSDSNKYTVIFPRAESLEYFIESANKKKEIFKQYITVIKNDQLFNLNFLIPILKNCHEDSVLRDQLALMLEKLMAFYLPYRNQNNISQVKKEEISIEKVKENQIIDQICGEYDLITGIPAIESPPEISVERNVEQNAATITEITVPQTAEVSILSPNDVKENIIFPENSLNLKNQTVCNNERLMRRLKRSHREVENSGKKSNDISDTHNQSNDQISCNEESNERKRCLRKRTNICYKVGGSRKTACQKSEPKPKKQKLQPLNKNIYAPNFNVISYIKKGISKSRLFIFPAADKKKNQRTVKKDCYEYFYNSSRKIYICFGCNAQNRFTHAIIEKDSDGKDFVKCLKNDHVCKLREYQPEKYLKKTVKRKPKITTVEDDENEENSAQNKNDSVVENFGSEENTDKTQTVPINSEICIKAPNYQLVKRKVFSRIVERLVIFDTVKKNMCYELTWVPYRGLYLCYTCKRKNKVVSAKIIKDDINGDYVKLNGSQHLCKLQRFKPEDPAIKNDEIDPSIIKLPNYQLVKRRMFGNKIVENLVIFHHADKKMCHEFTWKADTRKGRYACFNCIYKDKTQVEAKIITDENGEKVVQVYGMKHSCDMQIFVPENLDPINNSAPEFQLIKRKFNAKIVQHLVVFDLADKSKCYEYSWHRKKNLFICHKCLYLKKIQVFVRLVKNENDEESLVFGNYEHQCEPIKFVPEDPELHDLECLYP